MQPGMPQRIENRQQDQPAGARHGEDDRERTQHLLGKAEVLGQAARVAQPALAREAEVKEDGRDAAAGDEERFQALGADVGNVCYALVDGHGRVVRRAFSFPDGEHGD